MPICSRCHHEAPLIHEYVTRRISDRTILDYFVQLEVRIRRVECLHCKGCCQEYVDWLRPYQRCTERLRDHIEHRLKEETVAYAAQETDQSWDTVKAIDKTRLEREFGKFKWDNSGKLFKNPCSQAELDKIVPFGFSLQRQKNGVFCHQNSIIVLTFTIL